MKFLLSLLLMTFSLASIGQANNIFVIKSGSKVVVLHTTGSDTVNTAQGIPVSFNVPSGGARTAAGVFSPTGVLLKSIWENEYYDAGTHVKYWDGTDNSGLLMSDGNYTIKVDLSQAQYAWEGVIGNTSAQFTGPTIHRAFLPISSMAFTGTTGYYTTGYNEGDQSTFRINTSTPQQKTGVYPANLGQNTAFAATDGNYAYFAGDGVTPINSEPRFFVVATKVSDNASVTFANGAPIKSYASAIAISNASVGGLAVSSHLFVSHYNTNEIDVYDKLTGAQVQTISLSQCGRLATDGAGNLWAVTGNDVKKFHINSDGSLAAASLTVTGTVTPQAIAVSPDNSTLIVAYAEPLHIVKAFNTSTGASSWDLGTVGGYSSSPLVTNTKFDLTGSYLAFQPDGSFWVGDVINYRTLHFSSSRTYIDYIMYIPAIYNITVDQNSPSKVFANGILEFSVDYTKTLAPNNGSWALVRNYTKFIPTGDKIVHVLTMSNGRTYAFMSKNVSVPYDTKYKIQELLDSAPPRDCGNYDPYNFGYGSTQPYPDGTMRQSYSFANVPHEWRSYAFLGFDGSANPIWSSSYTLLAKTPPINTANDPWSSGITITAGEITSGTPNGNVAITFNPATPETDNKLQYHLGAVRLGDSVWLWKTARNTFKGYRGFFPTDGYFDIGNMVNVYGGSVALAWGRHIYWGYHGEFWKDAQCNWWQDVLDDGLMVGQFGANPDANSPAGMAGNAFSAKLAPYGGNVYMYHNDESYHAGVHRWKLSNMNAITQSTQTVSLINGNGEAGVLAEYFDGGDLNNFYNKSHAVVSNINQTTQPAGVGTSYSVRWRAFVVPQYSQNYTFYLSGNKGVKLFLNDSLVISNWTNSSSNEFTYSVSLIANRGYKLKVESGGGTTSLSWSSSSVSKQLIPSSNLIAGKLDAATSDGSVDLLEQVQHRVLLESGIYGWAASDPYSIQGTPDEARWRVKTGVETYRLDKSPDLDLSYSLDVAPSTVRTLTRNLGTNNVTTNWKLEGYIHYQNSFPNEGNGGEWIEVLDDAGKILMRFWNTILFDVETHNRTLYLNNFKFHDEPEATALSVLWNTNPLKIEGTSAGITLTYGPYAPVTQPIYDNTANWRKPTTLRFYFNGWKYERRLRVQSMRFKKDY